jgi:hypothetical protein
MGAGQRIREAGLDALEGAFGVGYLCRAANRAFFMIRASFLNALSDVTELHLRFPIGPINDQQSGLRG